MSLEQYPQSVRDAIRARNGVPILNGTIDHAAVITQEAFANAKHCVRILTSRLDPDCYGRSSVLNAAQYFLLNPDHRVEILIEAGLSDRDGNFEWDKHPFIKHLQEFSSETNGKRFQWKLVPKEWADQYTFNFLILDDYGYRYEADRNQPAAIAQFLPEDDPKESIKSLTRLFKQLWDKAEFPLVKQPA